MNESTTSEGQSPVPELAPAQRKLPRLRFPAICLLIFWVLSFVLPAVDKPYFVSFMSTLACTSLLNLLFLGWWWFNRGLRLWEKAAGFVLLIAEAWIVGTLS